MEGFERGMEGYFKGWAGVLEGVGLASTGDAEGSARTPWTALKYSLTPDLRSEGTSSRWMKDSTWRCQGRSGVAVVWVAVPVPLSADSVVVVLGPLVRLITAATAWLLL